MQKKISKFYKQGFIDLFHKQATINPNAIAVVAHDGQMTYDELNKKSNKLAVFLKRKDIKKENLIGLCTSLNTNFIVCLLGILKSGAAYFPLDPTYPIERLQFMLNDGKPAMILTDSKFSHLFNCDKEKIIEIDNESNCIHRVIQNLASGNVGASDLQQAQPFAKQGMCKHMLDAASCKDEDADDANGQILNHDVYIFDSISFEERDVEGSIQPNDLAYVIYTSGSTGKPKGIMVTHGSLSNIALAHNKYYPNDMKMLISGGVCFDASLLVIFHALINHEPLYLFDYSPEDKVETLMDFIHLYSISYMICVPSHYAKILGRNKKLPFLKCVSLTGEVLPKSLVELHAKLAPNAFMYNEYGPSECAIGTTIAKIYDPDTRIIQEITVGKPLDHTQIYILDHDLHILPHGMKGEIYISGIGLARGYLNNQALTEEKFVQLAFPGKKSIRLYRTGDLGRILPNGNLEFLGRIDQRIQMNEKWIDLGEIEYHIARCPGIKEFAVLVQTDCQGENELVAYVSTKKAQTKDFLVHYLKMFLPDHMIPATIVEINKFPLSPNGKINRDALKSIQ